MSISLRWLTLAGLLLAPLCLSTVAQAQQSYYDDPSGRVAYLNHSEGGISYSPAGEDEWLDVVRNRPLIRGDRLWTDRNALVELQIGGAAVRLGADTGFEILELDDRMAQLQITEGVLNLSIRRLQRGERYEVATPNLAFSIDRAGRYRIDVDPYRDETTIVVWEGAGEAWGQDANFPLRAGDTVRFYGSDLRDYQVFGLPRADEFDRYCVERDRRMDRSESLRYVSDDMIGYSSLDEYGSWRSVRSHGNVWFPTRVERDWAPYRDGHWVWQEPWGWTWVDNAPWGFAPSHYGRWVNVSNRWGWVPGPRNVRPVYAPALVAFVGGSNWNLSISLGNRSPIGWFPLGPREVYVPSYRASRDYFTRVNVNNTVINNTVINNVYNNYSSGNINVSQVNYANRSIEGAVTAVPSSVFINSRQVRQEAIRLDRNDMANFEYRRIAEVAPTRRSVLGSGEEASLQPRRGVFNRDVVARTPPPAATRAFDTRAEQLRQNPGRVPVQQRDERRGRGANLPANVRVIEQERTAVNARELDSRRGGGRPDAAQAERKPLDRSQESAREQGRGRADRGQADRGQADRGRGNQESRQQQAAEVQRQREATAEQIQQGQREANAQQEQRQRQAAQQERKEDRRQQQAAEQQAQREAAAEQLQQRQREANAQQEQRQQQAAQQERKEDRRQQQVAEQQRQRDAAAEQLQQRQREANAQQEQRQQQAAQQQRKEDARQQQAAEQQRQRDAAAEQLQQRQREANAQQEQRQQQAAQQQRKEDARQHQANEQQRQREAAAEQQRQREASAQQEQQEQRQRQTDAREQQAARQREAAEQARQRQSSEPRSDRPPAERRKPVPRKDPRTGKDIVEEEDEDDDDKKNDQRKERERR